MEKYRDGGREREREERQVSRDHIDSDINMGFVAPDST